MGEATKIEWCDHTFNPWWGCVRVSPGCEHCYAESFAKRVGKKVWGVQAERRFFGEKHWAEPLKWNAQAQKDGVRRRVFCASMADVFENRPDLIAPRERLFALIRATPNLDWLILTKRPEWVEVLWPIDHPSAELWPNVWLGTTVEDQRRADERLPHLLALPAAVHFVSYEPALEAVDLGPWLGLECTHEDSYREPDTNAVVCRECDSQELLEWVIVGGESGPGARPFDIAWARSVIKQCESAGVAVFCKQLGKNPTGLPDDPCRSCGGTGQMFNPLDGSWGGACSCRGRQAEPALGDAKGGDWSEWPADLRVRQWPEARP